MVRSSVPGDADYSKVTGNLLELADFGVPYVDFTGGNPLICEWLPDAIKLSNNLGIYSSLTVSGPMIPRLGSEFIGLPSILRFSIDGRENFHNKNRGPGFYDHIVSGLEMAKSLRKGKATQLIFTVVPGSGGNIDFDTLESVLTLARRNNVLINVNPLFNSMLSDEERSCLIWFAKQADVQVSRGRLRFMARGGNNVNNPSCRAVESVITITADNYLVLPCYHHSIERISLTHGIKSALDSPLRTKMSKNQGRFDFCQGCSIWCYIIPSWVVLAPFRLVAWLHSLSGLQAIRDNILRTAGRFHSEYPYPEFSPRD